MKSDNAISDSIDMDDAYTNLNSRKKLPEKSAGGEVNVLAELPEFYYSEGAVSDAVSTQLANLVDKMVKPCCQRTTQKKKWYRPQNCKNLVTTRVNPEIWAKLRSS